MMAQTCMTIIVFLAFIGMSLYAFEINEDWYKIAEEQNKDWLDTAMRQTEEWAEFCTKIANERDALKARVEELEAKLEGSET